MSEDRKKIIFVNNNMELGGVQRALADLLQALDGKYDISLFLFSPTGPYMGELPDSVQVICADSLFRCLGISQSQAGKTPLLYLSRAFLAVLTKLFGRAAAMRLILRSQKCLPEDYDAAISFLQNGGMKSFYGGCNEFVLSKIRADRKIGFIHCDYGHSGADTPYNNALYARFDRIAACSEGCRRAFLEKIPALADRCTVVTNCHNFDRIRRCAGENPAEYPRDGLNLLSVARLGHEKGIDRGIRAVAEAIRRGYRLYYHVVGEGPMRPELEKLIRSLGVETQVILHGGTANPYRYLRNADLLLIPSIHEAAPLVIDEAAALGVPVLSTDTTSAREMVEQRQLGWVCGNTQEALNEAVARLASAPAAVSGYRAADFSNRTGLEQFCQLIEQ